MGAMTAGKDAAPANSQTERRVRAFRSTDAFVVDVYRASTTLQRGEGLGLGNALRAVVVRCGGAVVAASAAAPGSETERRTLESALMALAEGRYYLYLARRFGLLDARRYRALTARQDAAYRELELAMPLPVAPMIRSRDPT